MNGEVIGISTFSSFRTINVEETIRSEDGPLRKEGNIRLLNAANVNFAVCSRLLGDWLLALSSDDKGSP